MKALFFYLAAIFVLTACASNQSTGHHNSQSTNQCPKDAVTAQHGTIPLLLTNEHGADRSHIISGIPERTGKGVARFVRLEDQYTDIITFELAAEIERLTGEKPFLIIAELNRSQVDFNRPPKLAYESHKLKPCYDDFHRATQKLVDEIHNRWQAAYLLDIHGQSKFPNKLIRGTRNGQSIKQLRQREGEKTYLSPSSLFGHIASLGYLIMPINTARETHYKGGYMLKTYGSHNKNGIDAIQIEIGRTYRINQKLRTKMINDLALSLVARLNNLKLIGNKK